MLFEAQTWECYQCRESFSWFRGEIDRLYCSNACRQAAYRERQHREQRGDDLHEPMTMTCKECGNDFDWPGKGRRPLYCGRTCNQRAYRRRKKERQRATAAYIGN